MSEEHIRAEFWKRHPFQKAKLEDPTYDSSHIMGKLAEFERGWQAALASQAKSVPDGWKLVPIEPTEDMKWKGAMSITGRLSSELEDYHDAENACDEVAQHYKAMLDAAPQVPTDDERVRALNQVFDNCRVIFFPKNGEYPIEHNPHANKISKDEILKAIASMSGEQG